MNKTMKRRRELIKTYVSVLRDAKIKGYTNNAAAYSSTLNLMFKERNKRG